MNKLFCKYLSDIKVDVNAINPKNGNTVLHDVISSSIFTNQLDLFKFLVEECKVDLNIANYFEMTPLIMAEVNGKTEITHYIIGQN